MKPVVRLGALNVVSNCLGRGVSLGYLGRCVMKLKGVGPVVSGWM